MISAVFVVSSWLSGMSRSSLHKAKLTRELDGSIKRIHGTKVEFSAIPNKRGDLRLFVLCPKCRKPKLKLFTEPELACRSCLKIPHYESRKPPIIQLDQLLYRAEAFPESRDRHLAEARKLFRKIKRKLNR